VLFDAHVKKKRERYAFAAQLKASLDAEIELHALEAQIQKVLAENAERQKRSDRESLVPLQLRQQQLNDAIQQSTAAINSLKRTAAVGTELLEKLKAAEMDSQ